MNLRTVTTGGQTYAFRPDRPPAPEAHSHRAIVRARLVDELTGLGVRGEVSVTGGSSDLIARVARDGVVGLTANPARRMTDLATNPVEVDVTLAAPRYLSHAAQVTLGPYNTGLGSPADFPDFFAPVDLGDITLRRMPVWISGRVVQEVGATRTPLAGVSVNVTEIWRAEPGPDDDPSLLAEAPDILSLSPGLYRDRPGATNTLRDRLITVAAQTKQLLAPVDAAATVLRLSDRVGLVVGDLLALDPGQPELQEFIEIAAIEGGLNADEPAEVTLVYPVSRTRSPGAMAAPATPAPGPGVLGAFDRDGGIGDRMAHLDAIQPTVTHHGTVEIAGDGAAEYQTAGLFGTVTDAEGNYRFPALSRVARLTIASDRFDFAQPISRIIGPDYRGDIQTIDFVHRP